VFAYTSQLRSLTCHHPFTHCKDTNREWSRTSDLSIGVSVASWPRHLQSGLFLVPIFPGEEINTYLHSYHRKFWECYRKNGNPLVLDMLGTLSAHTCWKRQELLFGSSRGTANCSAGLIVAWSSPFSREEVVISSKLGGSLPLLTLYFSTPWQVVCSTSSPGSPTYLFLSCLSYVPRSVIFAILLPCSKFLCSKLIWLHMFGLYSRLPVSHSQHPIPSNYPLSFLCTVYVSWLTSLTRGFLYPFL
jgi:hypothetical protein